MDFKTDIYENGARVYSPNNPPPGSSSPSTAYNGYPGWGIAWVSSSVNPATLSRTSSFNDTNGQTWYTPYYGVGSDYYNRKVANLIIRSDTGNIYYYNGNSSNCYTNTGKSIFGTSGGGGTSVVITGATITEA